MLSFRVGQFRPLKGTKNTNNHGKVAVLPLAQQHTRPTQFEWRTYEILRFKAMSGGVDCCFHRFEGERGGALRVIKNGALLPAPFLTVTVDSSGERGLLGVAFDPNFVSNQLIYVYYTATTPSVHNRISRFTASGDVALAGSEVVLMDLPNLNAATNHNGGALHFAPDGTLFVAVGDNANGANALEGFG